jgi:hypothetical protein
MSDEKKPFARIERRREHNHERVALYVADRFVASEPASPGESLPGLATEIAAAVEAREAKLRGEIYDLRNAVIDVVDKHYSGKCLVKDEPCTDPACCSEGRFRALLARSDFGEVVPTERLRAVEAELAAMRKHIEGTWGVLLQEAAGGGLGSPIARALGIEVGLTTPLVVPTNWQLDRKQMRKLAKLIGRPVITLDVERERLLGRDEPLPEEIRKVLDRRVPGARTWAEWERLTSMEIVDVELDNGRVRQTSPAPQQAREDAARNIQALGIDPARPGGDFSGAAVFEPRMAGEQNMRIFQFDRRGAPGTAATGEHCSECGRLPPPTEVACSWDNRGRAICFDCGHG